MYSTRFGTILTAAMRSWAVRRLFALFLAVFVTAGTSLSAVQASVMMAKMASGMSAPNRSDCGSCDGGGGSGAKTVTCASVCVAPALAVLAPAVAVMFVQKPVSFPARFPLILHGRASPPDPYPPRPTDIG